MKEAEKNLISYGIARTKEVAQMKDWRCRSKRARRMRQIARLWDGVMCLSIAQLKNLYPDVVPSTWLNDGKSYWWALEKESNSNRINFVKLF